MQFSSLFQQWAGEPLLEERPLGGGGSNRRYFRLIGASHHCIATIGEERRENEAFLYFSRHFKKKGLHVPDILAVGDDGSTYLQEDFGDLTLYQYLLDKRRSGGGFDAEMVALYRRVLDDLACFQNAGRDLDFGKAYPRACFDAQSLSWDFQYFKYYFLKLVHAPFDEQRLEDDFNSLAAFLLKGRQDCFMYRDFQGRNIMLDADRLCYIDYQGGRQGSPLYDVASLLYSAKSSLQEAVRTDLLRHYLDHSILAIGGGNVSHDEETRFYAYALARVMQALGAYGYRGYYEGKTYFLESIPLALDNLRLILGHLDDKGSSLPPVRCLPHLAAVLRHVVEHHNFNTHAVVPPPCAADGLTVTVVSFSYKQGVPGDPSGNGGGFVFDCRGLPNPGRYAEYRSYTGRDKQVRDFLEGQPAVADFLQEACALAGQTVQNYMERHFTHLLVAFGCTGGQHRSVYCAEAAARYLCEHYGCAVRLVHREQGGEVK